MAFLSFYSVIHMVKRSPWTCGLHDVICQCTRDMMSLVSDSRKAEFDLIELLLGQMPCLFRSDVRFIKWWNIKTVLKSLFILRGA